MEPPDAAAAAPTGPPLDIAPLLCEEAMAKLALLDYARGYCQPKDTAPFSRVYFALPASNASQQFANFAGLCAWLALQARRSFAPADRLEDPSSFIGRLMAELKAMGMEGLDFPPVRLRAAHGEPAARVLAFLADRALAARGFRWQSPDLADETAEGGGGAGEEVEDEAGLEADADGDGADGSASASASANGGGGGGGGGHSRRAGGGKGDGSNEDDEDGVEEEVLLRKGGGSASSSSSGYGGAAHGQGQGQGGGKEGDEADAPPGGVVLESAIDPALWRAEVERVAPRLRAQAQALPGSAALVAMGGGLAGAGGEWRAHVETTRAAESAIARLLPFSREQLERLGGGLAELLEVVAAREKFINSSFRGLAADFRAQSERQGALTGAAAAAQARVAALSGELAAVTEALEEARGTLEERGASMTDTSPLIRIKAALAQLRSECRRMDLQLGVLGHAVMQSRIAHKQEAGREGAGAEAEGGSAGAGAGGRKAGAGGAGGAGAGGDGEDGEDEDDEGAAPADEGAREGRGRGRR